MRFRRVFGAATGAGTVSEMVHLEPNQFDQGMGVGQGVLISKFFKDDKDTSKNPTCSDTFHES